VEISEKQGLKGTAPNTELSAQDAKQNKLVSHYFRAIFEVITSEFRYVTDLHVFRGVFYVPMTDSMGRELTNKLFPSLGLIIETHEHLLRLLIETLPSADDLGLEDVRHLERKTTPGYLDADAITDVSGARAFDMKAWGLTLETLEIGFCNPALVRHADELERVQGQLQRCAPARMPFTDGPRASWAVRVAEAMIKISHFLKVNIAYIANYATARDLVEAFEGEQFVTLSRVEQRPLLRGLRLRDFMIKPIQRVCKYGSLLKEVLKYTADETCCQIIKRAEDEVNEVTKVRGC
jgi:hypothetical protein